MAPQIGRQDGTAEKEWVNVALETLFLGFLSWKADDTSALCRAARPGALSEGYLTKKQVEWREWPLFYFKASGELPLKPF